MPHSLSSRFLNEFTVGLSASITFAGRLFQYKCKKTVVL